MRIVVQKYGGSSVADLERLRGVAERIRQTRDAGFSVVVAVSAMGNTTNELIALAKQVSKNPDRRELDMLISVGERIAMSLLAMSLRDLGVPACSLTGSQSGIITDDSHADARVIEVRPERVLRALNEGQVAIVAGFQGVSRSREVTTLGRGGTDTTAVVLAAALQAEFCEICSDVDGVWTADPRQIPEATKFDVWGLDEALTLARGGAKVLFEDAVRYARDRGITLQATSTFAKGTGTRLIPTSIPQSPVAVTADELLIEVELGDFPDQTILKLRQHGAKFRRRIGSKVHVDIRNIHGTIPDLPRGAKNLGPISVVTAVRSGLGEDLSVLWAVEQELQAVSIPIFELGSYGDQGWWQIPPVQTQTVVRLVQQALQ